MSNKSKVFKRLAKAARKIGKMRRNDHWYPHIIYVNIPMSVNYINFDLTITSQGSVETSESHKFAEAGSTPLPATNLQA
jgi:hypothetical protein